MSERQLFLNLGNTNVQWGVWEPEAGWVADGRGMIAGTQEALQTLAHVLEEHGPAGEGAGPIPVVTSRPDVDAWREAAREALGRELAVMGSDFRAEIRTLYRDPAELGQDRVANVLAALADDAYPCLILDAGTCVTADVLDEDGVHQGGAIAAGGPALIVGVIGRAPHLGAALSGRGAPVEYEKWALNTTENVLLGWNLGLIGVAQSLIDYHFDMTDSPGEVILTGGDAEILGEDLEEQGESVLVMPLLTLEGLRLAWEGAGEA